MKDFIAYLGQAASDLQASVDELSKPFPGVTEAEVEPLNVYPEDDYGFQSEGDNE